MLAKLFRHFFETFPAFLKSTKENFVVESDYVHMLFH